MEAGDTPPGPIVGEGMKRQILDMAASSESRRAERARPPPTPTRASGASDSCVKPRQSRVTGFCLPRKIRAICEGGPISRAVLVLRTVRPEIVTQAQPARSVRRPDLTDARQRHVAVTGHLSGKVLKAPLSQGYALAAGPQHRHQWAATLWPHDRADAREHNAMTSRQRGHCPAVCRARGEAQLVVVAPGEQCRQGRRSRQASFHRRQAPPEPAPHGHA